MDNKAFNYYAVIAKCGHIGKKQYIPIKFAVIADNGKQAAKKVRNFPRVKHNHKNAILSVTKINFDEFIQINKKNDEDLYLKCHSKQEQSLIENLEERIEIDYYNIKEELFSKEERQERVKFKLKKYKILQNERKKEMLYYAY